jgi:hypothetical protein
VNPTRQLSLVKGEHHFVFRYRQGFESEVIQAMAELAEDPTSAFDWFDAAVLSVQLGQCLELELDGTSAAS